MARGSTYLQNVYPYSLAVGLSRGRLGGLGDDSTLFNDYGIAARQAAIQRSQSERLNRQWDLQDAQQRATERERILDIAQESVKKAARSQVNILTSGQNQFRRLLFSGSTIAIFSLATIAAVSILGKPSKSKRSGRGRRSRKSRRSFSRSSPTRSPIHHRRRRTLVFSESRLS